MLRRLEMITVGTAGETVFDVLTSGSSLYPSRRPPYFAFDAAERTHADGVPEMRELCRGDVITFATVEQATGGAPPRTRLRLDRLNPGEPR